MEKIILLAEHVAELDETYKHHRALPLKAREELSQYIDNLYGNHGWFSKQCELVNISMVGNKEKSIICHIKLGTTHRLPHGKYWGRHTHTTKNGKVVNLKFSLSEDNKPILKISV